MKDIIKKLKKNLAVYHRLTQEEQAVYDAIPSEYKLYMDSFGAWVMADSGQIPTNRYRIHEDYQPKPDTPVFPGYVLHEAFEATSGKWWFKKQDGRKEGIEYAIGYGCVGGVFKEKDGVIMNALLAFYSQKHDILLYSVTITELQEGFKPATLGWVAFKE